MTVWQPSVPELKNENLSQVKNLVEERGLKMSALAAGVRMAHPAKKEDNLRAWDANIETACALGVEIMFSRTFPKPEGVDNKDAWKSCIELGKEMTQRCVDKGRVFAFECDHFNFVENLEQTLRLLEEIGMPEMKINFDPCNYYCGGDNPDTVMEALFDRFVHGHIKDAVRPEGEKPHEVPVGEGDLDYVKILGDLHRRGFEGAMVIEHSKSSKKSRRHGTTYNPCVHNWNCEYSVQCIFS